MTDPASTDDLVSQLQHVLDERGINVDVASFLAPEPSPGSTGSADDVEPQNPEATAAVPTVTEDPTESASGSSAATAASPTVEAGKAAVAELKTRFPTPVTVAPGQATIDDTVTQGNRVTTQAAVTPNNPLKVLTDRVEDHFNELGKVVSDIEAILARLKTLTNNIGVGL